MSLTPSKYTLYIKRMYMYVMNVSDNPLPYIWALEKILSLGLSWKTCYKQVNRLYMTTLGGLKDLKG